MFCSYAKLMKIATVVVGIIAIIFLSIYLPISFVACQSNPTTTSDYVYGAPCKCANNVGGLKAFSDAMFSQTHPSYISGARFLKYNTTNIYPIGYSTYVETYFAVDYTQDVQHNKTINLFNLYDPNNVGAEALDAKFNIYVYGCFYSNPVLGQSGYRNNSDECVAEITRLEPLMPPFEPFVDFSYQHNELYRDFCQLSECVIQECSTLASVNIIIFSISIIGVLFTILRVVSVIIKRFVPVAPVVESTEMNVVV